ncbi:MAG: M67 family metallopeptidase [Anaerolineales bacterium]
MALYIPSNILQQIHANGERAYPEEGAGLMLGQAQDEDRSVVRILPIPNAREDSARHNRYLITAQDMLHGEQEAARLDLDVVGIFHSHPDHPSGRLNSTGSGPYPGILTSSPVCSPEMPSRAAPGV